MPQPHDSYCAARKQCSQELAAPMVFQLIDIPAMDLHRMVMQLWINDLIEMVHTNGIRWRSSMID